MKRLLPLFLLSFIACTPSRPVATQPSIAPTQTASTAQSPKPSLSPSTVANPTPESTVFYAGTAYLKGLGINDDGSYVEHVNFEGSATLDASDKLYLRLSSECNYSSNPYQTAQIVIQLNTKAKTWKQLSHEYNDCDGMTGTLEEDFREQYQPYTVEDLGTQAKFNLGINDPEINHRFYDYYGVTINKQAEDRD